MQWGWVLVMVAIFIAACIQQEEKTNEKCTAPMILVAGECCTDQNANEICDDIENDDSENDKNDKKEEVQVKQATKVQAVSYMNRTQLEEDIIKAFPIKRYKFNETKRENLTGIEKTFDVRASKEIDILKMKKESDYIGSQDKFSDFIEKRYNLSVKNNNIWAHRVIDIKKNIDENWRDVEYDYEHSLEKMQGYFVEEHLILFHHQGSTYQGSWEYKLKLQCTLQLIVEVSYPEYGLEGWSAGGTLNDSKRAIAQKRKDFINDMGHTAEKIKGICEGKNPTKSEENWIAFYGRDGFEPKSIKIKKGGVVAVYNENPRMDGMVLLLVREKPTRKLTTTKITPVGKIINITFEEPGNYTIAVTNYDPRGSIVVE